MERSKFLKVTCPRCKHVQIVFGKSTSQVKCTECNYLLAKPTGGKPKIRASGSVFVNMAVPL